MTPDEITLPEGLPSAAKCRALADHLSVQYNHAAVTEAVKADKFDLARQMTGAIDLIEAIRLLANELDDDASAPIFAPAGGA